MSTEGSAEDVAAPESWEVADLDESMRRLMLPSSHDAPNPSVAPDDGDDATSAASASATSDSTSDPISQVDLFLREAIQNPRERLSSTRLFFFFFYFCVYFLDG